MTLTTVSGGQVPAVGLGTYPLQGRQMANVLIEAVKIGYRLIDTSDDYHGETGIGMGCSELFDKTGLRREDIFLQTKISQDNSYYDEPLDGIWFNPHSYFQQKHTVKEVVRDKVKTSLRELKTDYLDSILIHYPFPGYYEEVWNELVELQKEGVVRYIGVSNFFPKHIEQLKNSNVMPAINELFFSPLCTRNDMLAYFKEHDIQPIVYSSLLGVRGKIPEAIINPMMAKYNKTFSQIILRWHIDRGCIPLAKSKTPSRLKENFDVFDFHLDEDEINALAALNIDQVILPESQYCPGL
jgi:diketogulonate reductase-like aldo/keto reductase